MTGVPESAAGPRGRPRASTPEDIAAIAFEVFEEVGFEHARMELIARRAGIGRTTLFRYFPTKGSILWAKLAARTRWFAELLADADIERGVVESIISAYVRLYEVDDDHLRISKATVRLIETTPPEATGKWTAYATWGELVVAHVTTRAPQLDRLEARMLGMSIWAAIWQAVSAWSRSDHHIDIFLERVAALLAPIDAQIAATRPR